MDFFANLALGFSVAVTVNNLFLCFCGCLLGTLIGVLPGIGPIATIAILLPVTFGLDPVSALIMLSGIYYGAQYGGSTTAILLNIPGEASSVITAIDGHQMAKKGQAGIALGIAALGSFVAGSVSTLLIAAVAMPLTKVALFFGPVEYFSLMFMGLIVAVMLASGSVGKAIAMVLFGTLLSTVGPDLTTGQGRMTFGLPWLADGIDVGLIGMGLFGVAEILRNLDNPGERQFTEGPIGRLLPGRFDLRRALGPVVRGTGLGALLGILPGNGAVLASYVSYTLEKRRSKTPEQFGKGAIEGVAGPESANNAGAQTSFIPLLTLGIPPNAVMAMMVGGMMIHGIVPGPQIMTQEPSLFWGLIVSMWVGNLMLLVINLPLVGLWVKLLKVPYRLLYVAILLLCCVGVYSLNNEPADVLLLAIFGLLGYLLVKLGFELPPLALGLVLGGMMEENFRQAMLISRGSPLVFIESPLSAVFLALSALWLVIAVSPSIRRRRNEVFVEE